MAIRTTRTPLSSPKPWLDLSLFKQSRLISAEYRIVYASIYIYTCTYKYHINIITFIVKCLSLASESHVLEPSAPTTL